MLTVRDTRGDSSIATGTQCRHAVRREYWGLGRRRLGGRRLLARRRLARRRDRRRRWLLAGHLLVLWRGRSLSGGCRTGCLSRNVRIYRCRCRLRRGGLAFGRNLLRRRCLVGERCYSWGTLPWLLHGNGRVRLTWGLGRRRRWCRTGGRRLCFDCWCRRKQCRRHQTFHCESNDTLHDDSPYLLFTTGNTNQRMGRILIGP